MMVGEQGSHRADQENGGEGVLCIFFFFFLNKQHLHIETCGELVPGPSQVPVSVLGCGQIGIIRTVQDYSSPTVTLATHPEARRP